MTVFFQGKMDVLAMDVQLFPIYIHCRNISFPGKKLASKHLPSVFCLSEKINSADK
jgi:hypothetical protein